MNVPLHDFSKHADDALKYWGYTAGDGLSGVQQSYFQAFSALQQSDSDVDAFCDSDMTDWEAALFEEDGEHILRVRESLVMSLSLNKCGDAEREVAFSRYLKGWFDSVSINHLVIGRVFAYTSVPIVKVGVRGRFATYPGTMDEMDQPSKFGEIGRKNIAKIDLPKFSYEGSHDHSILAFRSKIPGSRFVKTVVGEKTFLRGYRDIEVPRDFPVELCEEFAGAFYVLYPYGLSVPPGGFPGLPGVYFEEHPWISPSEYVAHEWAEGVMVLTPQCEYRVKNVPTEEVLDNGVWEVAYGVRYGTGISGLMQIRPRPGKKPITKDQAIKVLKSVVRSSDLMRTVPESTRPVLVVHSGEYLGMVSVHQDSIYIDAGERTKVASVQLDEPVRTVKKAKPQLVEVPASLYGSKLLVVSQQDGLLSIGVRIERDGKPLDLPGGTRELGETPMSCLVREIWEELNIDVASLCPVYLGKSATEIKPNGLADACADIFVVAAGNVPLTAKKDFRWITYNDINPISIGRRGNFAEWLGRILRFVQSIFPAPENLVAVASGQAKVEPRTVIDEWHFTAYDFKGWPIGYGALAPRGIELYAIPKPPPIGTKRTMIQGVDVVEKLVPDFTQRNLLASDILSRMPRHDDDPLDIVLKPSSPVPVPVLGNTSTNPVVPVFSQNRPIGEVRVSIPPCISMAKLATLNYSGSHLSHEIRFYFVCYQILTSGKNGILTRDLYPRMKKNLNLESTPPGRILGDMVKFGWFRREPQGEDHFVTMNFSWQFINE